MSVNYFHPHYVWILVRHITAFLWKIVNYISAVWWKVSIGKNCKFRGKTIFRSVPDSIIKIGNQCTFLSAHRSNLIGVYSPCMISCLRRNSSVTIGNNCGFSGTVIGSAKKITLGNNVRCGANTMITDTDWHTDDYRTSDDKEVVIEDNVWLGYDVKVLKGVHIGENSLIGAGSIVTKDIPANCIAAGNPCKVIRKL